MSFVPVIMLVLFNAVVYLILLYNGMEKAIGLLGIGEIVGVCFMLFKIYIKEKYGR